MATRARNAEKVEFQDGTEVTLRPLTIKNLRTFMEQLADVQKQNAEAAEDADESGLAYLESFIDLALFCLNAQRDKQMTKEELEEVIDLPTVQDVLRVCGGIELGNQTATTAASPLGRR